MQMIKTLTEQISLLLHTYAKEYAYATFEAKSAQTISSSCLCVCLNRLRD